MDADRPRLDLAHAQRRSVWRSRPTRYPSPRATETTAAESAAGSNTVAPVNAPPKDSRPPRGALIVIAVGLLACVAAALLTTDKGSGEAANLEWVQSAPIADSKPVQVPGGSESMQLTDGEISATGTNVSGYSLFRVASTLRIDAGAPVGDGRILCSVKAGQRTEIAQTAGGLRATYPRSSEAGIYSQEVPETILIDFSARGSELAVLEADDIARFTTEKGVKLEWPDLQGRDRAPQILHRRRQAEAGAGAALLHGLEDDDGPRRHRCLHGDHQRRRSDRPHRGRAEEGVAADRRRSRRGSRRSGGGRSRRGRRTGRSEGMSAQPVCGATSSSGPSSIPLPTLFSFGLAGRAGHPARVQRPAHRHRVLDAEVGAQPGRLGLGAGQDRRHPVVDRARPPRSASW